MIKPIEPPVVEEAATTVMKKYFAEFTSQNIEGREERYARTKHHIVHATEGIVGIFLIWFGIINAGSYFAEATRFGGALAEFFYINQIGTLCIILGVLFVYDGLRRSGRI